MAEKVKNTEKKTVTAQKAPTHGKVAVTDDRDYAANMAHLHGRPCESSAVFEAWAKH